MQNREKYLAIGFGGFIALWLGSGLVSSWVFAPFRERADRLETLATEIESLESQAMQLARVNKQLKGWKSASLPPDRGAATSKRPDALDAQRLYQTWLTDLAHLSGFDGFSVRPAAQRKIFRSGKGSTAKTVYVAVVITIETEGRFSQLCTFLDHFYRANLLHRISELNVESKESEGDPILRISLNAEGLALVEVPWRRSLFPETTLSAALSDEETVCTVATKEGFPTKVPFRVRAGTEYLNVTAVNGNTWTISRGVDRTFATRHAASTRVELAPIRPDVPSRSQDEFRELLAANVFIKPPPPKDYRLVVGPNPEQAFARGSTWIYTVPVSNYDPTLGKPEFLLKTTPPAGLEFDRGLGRFTWKPADGQQIGTFPLELEVRHPSAEKGVEVSKFAVIFREPNSAPVVGTPAAPVAYIGRPWKFLLDIKDAETALTKMQFKLESPPEGLTLNAADATLLWTPAATATPGEQTITVLATDDGIPPQTTTLKIAVKLEEDAAKFTYFVGAVSVDDAWQAWLYNRALDKRTVVRVGDMVQVADVSGAVAEIGKDFIVLKTGEVSRRLNLGQNLRDLPPLAVAVQPASTPR